MQVLQKELHLLDDAPANNLVVLVQTHDQTLPEQYFVMKIALNQRFQSGRIGLRAELQRVFVGELRGMRGRLHAAIAAHLFLIVTAGPEKNRSGQREMKQRFLECTEQQSARARDP